MNSTTAAIVSVTRPTSCPSLARSGLSVSSDNVTAGAIVRVGCTQFGHQPTGGIQSIMCLQSGTWSPPVPACEWSWDFTTQEKVVFGTVVACGSFIIVIFIAIIVAYCCCYRKRRAVDKKIYDSSYHEPSARAGYEGPYRTRGSIPGSYLAYQDTSSDGTVSYSGTLDNPWLGYIPRPKVKEGHGYK